MISLKTIKKIDPEMAHLTDDELEKIRQSFYEFGQLMFEDWHSQKFGPKSPVGVLTRESVGHKICLWTPIPQKQE